MNMSITNAKTDGDMAALKKLAGTVYICQVLTFAFAGLPLLVGVAINFLYRNDVKGTWLESHFNWQIKTVWVTLAGFALSGLVLMVEMQISLIILIPTLLLLVYRIVVGWTALSADKAVMQDLN
ncbi:hypothetical protein IVG45_06165 [Methylomonas sp. LL1]|uniref:DUF4870 family protein n=1 Tax=Methylomonas sp. LL1 TaxID=2785785 RepID=UPI0018C3882C|nr:hypothetical protein [Methylomonas sp. LL1]QPK64540.1 hypothetical protein IVG45_06165 [Methylomonas sp. LL1]